MLFGSYPIYYTILEHLSCVITERNLDDTLDFNGGKKILSLMFWMKVKKMIYVEKMIGNREKTHGNLCVIPLTCMLSLECALSLNCTLFGKAFLVLGT